MAMRDRRAPEDLGPFRHPARLPGALPRSGYFNRGIAAIMWREAWNS